MIYIHNEENLPLFKMVEPEIYNDYARYFHGSAPDIILADNRGRKFIGYIKTNNIDQIIPKYQRNLAQIYTDNILIRLNDIRAESVKEGWDYLIKYSKKLSSNKYLTKQEEYKEQLNKLEVEMIMENIFRRTDSIPLSSSIYQQIVPVAIPYLTTKEKIEILRGLVALAGRLIHTYDKAEARQFALLEQSLLLQRPLIEVDPSLIQAGYLQKLDERVSEYITRKKQEILLLVALIKAIGKLIFKNFKSDLRLRFRSIIRFLFKNMNDESGDHNNQFALKADRLFMNLIYYKNGKQGDYRATPGYMQPAIAYSIIR